MTAFVLGATGLVGREVVRQLCVRGARAFAHVRPDSRQLPVWTERFNALGAQVDSTPWQADALAARWRELSPAQIFILIGTTRARARTEAVSGDIYEAVDLGLTRLAVDAARMAGSAARLVYLSSIGADARARSPYLRARGKAEALVQQSGLPWAIARPSFIVGDRDDRRPGEAAAAATSDVLLSVAGLLGGRALRARYRSTTADVLASALIRIGEAPDSGRIFDGDDLR